MSRVRVKVCGITSEEDARAAVAFGADAIGLLFSDSPRQVSVAQAQVIRKAIGPFVSVVGVFVNEPIHRIVSVVDSVGLTTVQLHGDEEAQTAREIQKRVQVIKAFRIKDQDSFTQTHAFSDISGFLFDTYVPGQGRGGTGQSFNWSYLNEETKSKMPRRPWILAGGLHPDNVEEAIRSCQPYGVDVSSGVEAKPGMKDASKMRQFIERVRLISR